MASTLLDREVTTSNAAVTATGSQLPHKTAFRKAGILIMPTKIEKRLKVAAQLAMVSHRGPVSKLLARHAPLVVKLRAAKLLPLYLVLASLLGIILSASPYIFASAWECSAVTAFAAFYFWVYVRWCGDRVAGKWYVGQYDPEAGTYFSLDVTGHPTTTRTNFIHRSMTKTLDDELCKVGIAHRFEVDTYWNDPIASVTVHVNGEWQRFPYFGWDGEEVNWPPDCS